MPRWAVAAPCRPTHVRRDNSESFSLLSSLLKIKIRHIRSTLEWIKAAADVIRHAKITTLLLPGIGTVPDLKAAYNAGARVVRIDTHCTETDVSKQHIEYARELGMDTAGFLMMSHMIPDEQLAAQAKLMESYGATRVYMADSGGAMNMQDIRDRVRAFKAVLKPETETGMHAHHNLSPREADSITAAATGSTPALRAVRRWRCSLLPQNASVGTTVPTGTDRYLDGRRRRHRASAAGPTSTRRPRNHGAGCRSGGAEVWLEDPLHPGRTGQTADSRGGQENMIVDMALDLLQR